MTREAKIGMLTGLGVILLIGVLLSNYLGTGSGPGPAARMASLPIGGGYRQQMMQPVVAPGMLPVAPSNGSGAAVTFAMDNETGSAMVPTAYASNTAESVPASGPTMSRAVTPIAAGPAPVGEPAAGSLPTIALVDVHVPAATLAGADAVPKAVKAATANTTYLIASGDTLMKIARKFYGSEATTSDVQRIVAANPSALKDANTMLVIGKKLVIANVPVASVPNASKRTQPEIASKPDAPAMISLPGSPDAKAKGMLGATPTALNAKKESAPKTYVVQAGDTLEKIARKFAPSNSTQLVVKLKRASNGIKGSRQRCRSGRPLKVPVW